MKILILGISTRAMAESAVGSGYAIVALDAFGDKDLKRLTEAYSLRRDFDARYSPHALYIASRSLTYDAVAYTSNLENHPGILERIGGGRRIIGNSPQILGSVRDWAGLFTGLKRSGFLVPETIFAGEKREADSHRRWLVKPVASGGGHGIDFQKSSKFPGSRFVRQEFIPGTPCSASFVANGRDCVVLGITRQLTGMHSFGASGFRYCGNILPLPEATKAVRGLHLVGEVRRLVEFLTCEYRLNGVNGVDFVLNGEHIVLTEVNPRYSASMELIEQAYDLPIFHLHAEAALEGRLPDFRLEAVLGNENFFGKAVLFAERNAVAPDTKGWLDSGARDIPERGEILQKGNPICTVLAKGRAFEETLTELIRKSALLKEEIYV
ncbi:MAG TPA: ATP-grasp domain-containing protein [Acidobacteriota bacterium]|nr:ATP-grasp domain-containing protein [Acidobacteriota bacterium]